VILIEAIGDTELKELEEELKELNEALEKTPDDSELVFKRGTCLIKMNRYDEAEEELKRADRLRPCNTSILNNLAAAYIKMGKFKDALKTVTNALKIKNDQLEVMLNHGEILTHLNRHSEAKDVFERILELNPENTRAMDGMGQALSRLGQVDEGLALMLAAADIDPVGSIMNEAGMTSGVMASTFNQDRLGPVDTLGSYAPGSFMAGAPIDPQMLQAARTDYKARLKEAQKNAQTEAGAYKNIGIFLTNIKQHHLAVRVYEKILKINPEDIETLNNLADEYIKMNEIEKAKDVLKQVLKMDGKNIWAMGNMGTILANKGKYKQALKWFEKVLEVDEKNPYASYSWYNIGSVNMECGNYDSALKAYENAVEKSPKMPEFRLGKSLALMAVNRLDEAVKEIDLALEIDPELVDAWTQKMKLYVEKKSYNEAIVVSQHIEKIEPLDVDNLVYRAKILLEINNYQECMAVLKRAGKLDPDNREITMLKAVLMMREKDVESAMENLSEEVRAEGKTFNDVIKNLPKNSREKTELISNIGVVFCMGGNYVEGILAFEKAIKMAPKDYMPVYNLGLAQEKLGKKQEALRTFKKAFDLVDLERVVGGKKDKTDEDGEYVKDVQNLLEYWYQLEIELKMPDAALSTIDKAIELFPNHWRHWYNKSMVLLDLGKKDEGFDCLLRSQELKAKEPWLTAEKIAKFKENFQKMKDFFKTVFDRWRKKRIEKKIITPKNRPSRM
jgi:tetratricopeptide (TPR) repeat protein